MAFIPGEGNTSTPNIDSVNGSGISINTSFGGVDFIATSLVAGTNVTIVPSLVDKSITIDAVPAGPTGILTVQSGLGSGITATTVAGNCTLSGSYVAGSNITLVPSGVNQNIEINAALGSVGSSNGSGITITPSGTSNSIAVNLLPSTGINITSSGVDTSKTIINTGVTTALAGAGIGVSNPNGTVTFSNTGVLSATAGSGIGVSGATGNVTFSNTGVTQATAGAGIGVTANTGNVTFSNTGLLGLTSSNAGSGIFIGGTPTNPLITATGTAGVTQATAGAGITLTPPTGTGVVNIANSGVTSITSANAGAGISITGTSTNPTIANTGLLQLTSGNAGSNITIGGTPTAPQINIGTNNTSPGGSIGILTDNFSQTYYGLKSFNAGLQTLNPANNGTANNDVWAAGLMDLNIVASPQTGGTDLQVGILFSETPIEQKQYILTPGVGSTIISNNSIGNNNMSLVIKYWNNLGVKITVPGSIQLSPGNYVTITPFAATATNSNGTPYSFRWLRVSGGGVTGGIL